MPITTGPATVYIGAPGATWQGWNQAYTMTTTGSTSLAWDYWNQAWTSIGTTTGSSNWLQWNVSYTEARPVAPAVPVTDEVLQQRRREQAEAVERARQQQEEHRQLVEAAHQRAEELLTALLTDEQAVTWREHSWFTVRGNSTGRTYRIRRGISGNVDLMAEYEDAAEVTYCAHPPGIPAEDVCLAQMFLLCTDEDAFLRVANVQQRHTVRGRPVRERQLAAVA